MAQEKLPQFLLNPEQELRATKLAPEIAVTSDTDIARLIVYYQDALKQCAVSYIALANTRREDKARLERLKERLERGPEL